MTVSVTEQNPTLPPVYDGHGFYVHLLLSLLDESVLTYLGITLNAGGQTGSNYTVEIRQSGVALNLATYGLQIDATSLEILPIAGDLAAVAADATLTDITIFISDNVAVDTWESPPFEWVVSNTAPVLPILQRRRNWDNPAQSGYSIDYMLAAAEDYDGRQVRQTTGATTRAFDLHSLPLRRGQSANDSVVISQWYGRQGLLVGNKDTTIKVEPEGYIPLLHLTTDSEVDYTSDDVKTFGDNSTGDLWIVHAVKDWRSLDPKTGTVSSQQNDPPYSGFATHRFFHAGGTSGVDDISIAYGLNQDATAALFTPSFDFRYWIDGGLPPSVPSGSVVANIWAHEALDINSDNLSDASAFNDVSDTHRIGATNNTAVYGSSAAGENAYLIFCYHKGIFTNPTGNPSHKISYWMTGQTEAAPFEFYLPLSSTNQDNSLTDLNFNSAASQNLNFYSTIAFRADESLVSFSDAYATAVMVAESQHTYDKFLPNCLVTGSEDMYVTDFIALDSNGGGLTQQRANYILGDGNINSGLNMLDSIEDDAMVQLAKFSGFQINGTNFRIFADADANYNTGDAFPIAEYNVKWPEDGAWTVHTQAGFGTFTAAERWQATTAFTVNDRRPVIVTSITQGAAIGATGNFRVRCNIASNAAAIGQVAGSDAITTDLTADYGPIGEDGIQLLLPTGFLESNSQGSHIADVGTLGTAAVSARGGRYRIEIISATEFDIIGLNDTDTLIYTAAGATQFGVDNPSGCRCLPILQRQLRIGAGLTAVTAATFTAPYNFIDHAGSTSVNKTGSETWSYFRFEVDNTNYLQGSVTLTYGGSAVASIGAGASINGTVTNGLTGRLIMYDAAGPTINAVVEPRFSVVENVTISGIT